VIPVIFALAWFRSCLQARRIASRRIALMPGFLIVSVAVTACSLTVNQVTSSSTPAVPSHKGLKQDPLQTPSVKGVNPLPAQRPASETRDQALVESVDDGEPLGLKLAQGQLIYNDGDVLKGVFRVYCPTRMIRPTRFELIDVTGRVKKQGDWWEPAFTPRWQAEKQLIAQVCLQ
jgi:hypothetical protein